MDRAEDFSKVSSIRGSVCVDIILAGFTFAESSYHHQVGHVMQNTQEPRDVSDIVLGPVIARLDKRTRKVEPVKRASPSKRNPVTKATTKAASSAGSIPIAAASAGTSVAQDLIYAFKTPMTILN